MKIYIKNLLLIPTIIASSLSQINASTLNEDALPPTNTHKLSVASSGKTDDAVGISQIKVHSLPLSELEYNPLVLKNILTEIEILKILLAHSTTETENSRKILEDNIDRRSILLKTTQAALKDQARMRTTQQMTIPEHLLVKNPLLT